SPATNSHPLRAAADGHDAGARDLDQAERNHERHEALDLLARAGDLEHEAFGRSIDHAGAERVGESQRLHAVLPLAAHLDHGEFALDVRSGYGHVDDAVHRHEPVELILDLLDHHRRAARHDSDAREVLLVLGFGDRERIDVVAAAGEEADHPRQHARLVVDPHRQGMGLGPLRDSGWCSRAHSRFLLSPNPSAPIVGGQSDAEPANRIATHTITLPSSVMASSTLTVASPSSISLWARPEGIIGKQFSLGSTTQSKITGLFTPI